MSRTSCPGNNLLINLENFNPEKHSRRINSPISKEALSRLGIKSGEL